MHLHLFLIYPAQYYKLQSYHVCLNTHIYIYIYIYIYICMPGFVNLSV